MATVRSGVYVEGLREAVKTLESFGVEVADLKAVFTEIGEDVAVDAKRIIRDRTGRTGNTIRPAKAKNKATVRAGSARVKHAGVLNFGWPRRGIRATGFLTTPANNNLARHIQTVESGLADLIRRYQLGGTP